MSKRLVLVFCALFAFAAAVPAFAAVQNIKVSGDIVAQSINRDNFDLDKDATGTTDSVNVFNSIVRLKIDADLTDNVATCVRLINERNWDVASVSNTDIDLDLAYVTMKEFLYSPLTVTIGRQELHFGNDMIIGDGVGAPVATVVSGAVGTNQTTNYTEATGWGGINGDLAYRKAFDAIRATLNYDPLVIDLVFAKIDANTLTGGTNSDDIDLWGINAGYKLDDKWNSKVEGYVWTKMNYAGANLTTVDKTDSVVTIGGRISTNPTDKINLQQEVAYQGGKKVVAAGVGRDRNAWASQTMGTYTPGWKHNPTIGMIYSYFSGDASKTATDPSKTYHEWDPMFENQTAGHIINALFPNSNCHNIDLMMTLKPEFLEDVTLRLDWVYQALSKAGAATGTLNLNDYDGGGYNYQANKKYLGQEVDIQLLYDYTEDVQFGLLTGWFFPGRGALAKTSREDIANEAIVSCKVSF